MSQTPSAIIEMGICCVGNLKWGNEMTKGRLMLRRIENRFGFHALFPKRIWRWYERHTTDVYLLSFPKCGRTWLRMMIGKAIASHFHVRETDYLDIENLSLRSPYIPRIEVDHEQRVHYKRSCEVSQTKEKYKGSSVILLVRDPRDVIVSLYFHKTKRDHEYAGSLSEFLYEEVGGFETLLRFYNSWADNRFVPKNFLMVRYEDMHKAPSIELRRVIDFLGFPNMTNEHIMDVVQFASVENMRRMEMQNKFNSPSLKPGDPKDQESFKVRKAKVGGYVNYLAPDEIAYLSNRINSELSGFFRYGTSGNSDRSQ